MKVLLVGGCGRIGRRYQAVLNYLKVPFAMRDPLYGDGSDGKETHVIIAAPTDKHVELCTEFGEKKLPFLCEKPLGKDLTALRGILQYQGYVVNNYAFAFDKYAMDSCKIKWNYFNHGPDTLDWDCCQLLYLDRNAKLFDTGPVWECWDGNMRLDYGDLEYAYISMVEAFLAGDARRLWNLEEGYEMSMRVWEREHVK